MEGEKPAMERVLRYFVKSMLPLVCQDHMQSINREGLD